MERKKSQGPGAAMIAGSAVVLCVLLIGISYFFRNDGQDATDEQATPAASEASTALATGAPAASTLKPLLDRCDEGFNEDAGAGRTRTRCTAKRHPAFMMEALGDGDEVERASMLVPMRGTLSQLLERTQVGLELFGLVAGTKADVFLPRDYLDAMGTSETSFVFQGRVYITQPIANVGLLFVVMPEAADSEPEN
jgi:hypothetical protein